jgi:hypothetical protein
MTANAATAPLLHDHLTESLRLGEPDIHDSLAVFPIFGPQPELDYVSFAQGVATGLTIKELETGASVNDLIVLNPTDQAVLLYEGEEVLGAQQNRTFDVSVLVGARSQLRVPVSCVEAGRWDHTRQAEPFEPAPQAAYPALRALQNRAARASVAAGMEARASQQEVWAEVDEKSERMGVESATGAMQDIYGGHRDRLREFRDAIRLHDGQTGALVLIGGEPTVLDHVSRPEVFAALHAPLVQGYALDALEVEDAPLTTPVESAEAFLLAILEAHITEHDGIGLGRDLRFAEPGVAGAGLVAGNELVQLTAFRDTGPSNTPGDAPHARIRRPARGWGVAPNPAMGGPHPGSPSRGQGTAPPVDSSSDAQSPLPQSSQRLPRLRAPHLPRPARGPRGHPARGLQATGRDPALRARHAARGGLPPVAARRGPRRHLAR